MITELKVIDWLMAYNLERHYSSIERKKVLQVCYLIHRSRIDETQSVFEKSFQQPARLNLRYILPSFRRNLSQIATHILQKAFFKYALVYMWMTFSMSYKIMKTEWYKLNIGNKKIIYRKTVDGLFLYLFEKEEKQCEVSDVLVLNKNGEISCYYVDENYPQ